MALKSLMPGEHDWMQNAGVPFIPPSQPTPQALPANPYWMQGAPQAAQNIFRNPDFALALLANSGYSPYKRSLGEVVGTSMLQARGMQDQRAQQALDARMREAQIRNLDETNDRSPNSVREYEFAKSQGFTGSFQDWIVAGGQSSRPSAVQEWEHYAKLMEDDKKNGTNNAQLYLEMKRNPNFVVKDVNQVPTAIAPSHVAGVQTTPLSNLPATTAAAGAVKQAEAAGSALGTAQGNIAGGIQSKGADAQQMLSTIQMAGGLLDKSTGSWIGSMIDKGASVIGKSTEGAQAAAQLKVLEAGLLSFVPKMTGPQSDADRLIYIQAIGEIGDATKPRETRKAALKTVEEMQRKYIDMAKSNQIGPNIQMFPPGATDAQGWTSTRDGGRVRLKPSGGQ